MQKSVYTYRVISFFGQDLGTKILALVDSCNLESIECDKVKSCETLTSLTLNPDDKTQVIYTDENCVSRTIPIEKIIPDSFTFDNSTGIITLGLSDDTEDTNLTVDISSLLLGPDYVEINYTDLVTKIINNELVPQERYLILDFRTEHIIPESTDLNIDVATIPVEPLFVLATSTNTIASRASSLLHPQDIIEYSLSNDWWGSYVAPGSKGAITRRISPASDPNYPNVDVGQDFRHIYLRSWEFDYEPYRGTSQYLTEYTLYKQSIDIGHLWDSGAYNSFGTVETLNTTGAANYVDTLMFDSSAGVKNIFIGSSLAFDTENLINWVCIDTCYNVNIKEAQNCRVRRIGSLNELNQMSNCILTPWYSSRVTYLNEIQINNGNSGSMKSVFSTVSLFYNDTSESNAWFNLSVHGDWTASFPASSSGTDQNGNIVGGQHFFGIWGKMSRVANVALKVRLNHRGHILTSLIEDNEQCSLYCYGRQYYPEVVYRGINMVGLTGDTNKYVTIDETQNKAYGMYLDKINNVSQVEVSIDLGAVTSYNLNIKTGTNPLLAVAGLIDFAGTGVTVTIDMAPGTEYSNNTPHFTKILRPEAGLTLSIPPSAAFAQKTTITADGTNGEVIIIVYNQSLEKFIASN